MKVTLMDGVAMNKMHPDTFYIPSDNDKATLEIGDSVKLGLEGGEMGERMWFTIISKDGKGNFAGELDSIPVVYTALEPGDVMEFEAKNIIDIN